MNLIKKYKNLGDPVKASMWFLVCGFLQKAVSMITTPIFTRILTEDQYGQYSIYQSWYSIISIIAGLNLAAGVYIRGLVKNEGDEEAFSSSMLGLSLTSTVICFLIYFPFRAFFNKAMDLPTSLIICMFINVMMATVYNFWSARQRVDFKYKKLVVISMINVTLSPVAGVIAVLNTPAQYKVIARVVSIVVVDLVLFLWMYISIFAKGKKFYIKEYWKYALAFNLPLIPHYLSQILLNHSDRIMINNICGTDKAGIYSVACSIAYVMHIFNSSLSNTMNPWMYKSIKKGNYKEIAKVSYYVFILLAVVNLALIIVAPEAISIIAPPSYHSAVWAIPPVACSVFFMFMYTVFVTFGYYYEKTKFVMVASLIGAGLNILLNYIFLNLFKSFDTGFIAAGYTSLFCYMCYALGHYLFMRRINKKCMNGIKVYNEKIILLITVIFLAASALATMLYPYPIIRWGLIVAIALTALIMKKKIIEIFKKMKQRD